MPFYLDSLRPIISYRLLKRVSYLRIYISSRFAPPKLSRVRLKLKILVCYMEKGAAKRCWYGPEPRCGAGGILHNCTYAMRLPETIYLTETGALGTNNAFGYIV